MRNSARAFTLVEASISVVIVAVLLSAVVQTVGASNLTQYKITERKRARQLANSLLAEIMAQDYSESAANGPDSGETRATFDDVDDYNGLAESPPINKDGTAINILQPATWQRKVNIVWVDSTTLAAASSQVDTGVKQITVSVYHNQTLVLKLVAIRTVAS